MSSPIDDPDPVLFTTGRLRVRRLGLGDYDAMFGVYSDAEGMRFVDDGEPITAEDCRAWIDVTARNYARRGYGMSAVELADSCEVVGFCGLVHPGGQEEAELKYAYARSHWGRGLATEAAIGMLAYGERAHGLSLVIATTDPRNTPSHRVLLKAGMRDAGIRVTGDGERIRVFEWESRATC